MAENHRWNPWRALRDRHWLTLEWCHLERCHGRLVEDQRGRRVQLDHRLGRRERNATLAHELVHDERGLLYVPGTPPGLVEKEEHWVRTITARRLVPPGELARYVARLDGDGVTAMMVAEEFDVPVEIAHTALRLWVSASGRPATGRG